MLPGDDRLLVALFLEGGEQPLGFLGALLGKPLQCLFSPQLTLLGPRQDAPDPLVTLGPGRYFPLLGLNGTPAALSCSATAFGSIWTEISDGARQIQNAIESSTTISPRLIPVTIAST